MCVSGTDVETLFLQAIGAADGLQALQPHLPAWAEALQRMPVRGAAAFAGPLLRAPASGLLVQVCLAQQIVTQLHCCSNIRVTVTHLRSRTLLAEILMPMSNHAQARLCLPVHTLQSDNFHHAAQRL